MGEPQQQMLTTVDARVTVEGRPIRESSKTLMTISCAACGQRLAYGNNEERAVTLAVNNASHRPCCDAWEEP